MTATPHNGKRKIFSFFFLYWTPTAFMGNSGTVYTKLTPPTSCAAWSKRNWFASTARRSFQSARHIPSITNSPTLKAALYESVTHYVQTEMGKADQLAGSRKGSVGFAHRASQ